MLTPLLTFYSGSAPDAEGRLFDQLLALDDVFLEETHDYIQWLFPLPEPSAFNYRAPLLTAPEIVAFRDGPHLWRQLARALDRMLAFYGYAWTPGRRSLAPAANFADRAAVWLHPGNHNHLRLTRILRSLTLLGRAADAAALQAALERLESGVTLRTRQFWRTAITAADPSIPSGA
jgi:hypothetical protein